MCGICGYVSYREKYERAIIDRMVDTMVHRGPDDRGAELITGDGYQLALGQRRLSILDLSSAGHQPMSYENITIVYNGEVYNFLELRRELKALGHGFKSNCDTEVILHAFKEWGIACLDKFIGMFAFVIYDSTEQRLYLVRDRAGVKPLFYYEDEVKFIFGSELKSLLAMPGFDKTINDRAVAEMFQYTYIPLAESIFTHVHKLLPGEYMVYDLSTRQQQKKCYWDIQDFYTQDKLKISYDEALEELADLLRSALRYRMIADVPVGVFLSGGYDSALVAGMLKKDLGYDITTFTIGFHEGNNEAPAAEKIAALYGTNQLTRYCSEADALKYLSELPRYYDEPYSNPGSIAFMLVSALAKENVTVALSADGADELFGGYTYYDRLFASYEKIKRLHSVTRPARGAIRLLDKSLEHLKPSLRRGRRFRKMMTTGKLTRRDYIFSHYHGLDSEWDKIYSRSELVVPEEIFSTINTQVDSPDFGMIFDFKALMPDNYVVKIERGSMFTSLECRAPFLDHRIAEFAARLPLEYKFGPDGRKRIVRDLCYRYVPREIIDKPKTGFVVPWESWVRRGAKEYVLDTLSATNLTAAGFNADYVLPKVQGFMRDGSNGGFIFPLLQYVAWYNMWVL